eukprot:4254962-Pleurochrysis_carterae.AAC.1
MFDPTSPPPQPKPASPELSPTPSDRALIHELERVESERRELERAELASLKAQVATLLAANAATAPLNKPACPASPTQRSTPQPGRMQGCIALSILLNIAALCAAISVGAMQLLDTGARPRFIATLCLLSCAVTM